MNRSSLNIINIILIIISIYCVEIKGTFVTTVYTVRLDGQQVNPVNGDPLAFGVGICFYNRNVSPKRLDCQIQHDLDLDVGAPYYASIMRGKKSVVGKQDLYVFDEVDSYFRQAFQLQDIEDAKDFGGSTYTVEQQEKDFLNGLWYIKIQSAFYPQGAIRGQLLHEDRVYSSLSGRNVEPEPTNSANTGIAIGRYSEWYPERRTIDFSVSHNVNAPTGIAIHEGDTLESGPIITYFDKYVSTIESDLIRYDYEEEVELFEELQYLQIYSVTASTGEIRGQLNSIDYLPPATFTSRLSGLNVNPTVTTSSRGCALVTFDCSTQSIEFMIFHSVNFPILAEIREGNDRSNGDQRYILPRSQSPIYGKFQIQTVDVSRIFTDNLYFNIRSQLEPAGEIRGQITTQYDWYSYLSGINVISPKTTSAVGCATFRLAEKQVFGRVLDYDIHHSVSDPLAVELYVGQPGQIGVLNRSFKSLKSPISGIDEFLSDTEVQQFTVDKMFLQIRSDKYFQEEDGEIRGQITRLSHPCPDPSSTTGTLTDYDIYDRYNTPSTPDFALPSFFSNSPSLVHNSPFFSSLSFVFLFISFLYFLL